MEAFYDNIYDQFPESLSEEDREKLAGWCWDQMSNAYKWGYQAGQSDAGQAKEFAKDENIA